MDPTAVPPTSGAPVVLRDGRLQRRGPRRGQGAGTTGSSTAAGVVAYGRLEERAAPLFDAVVETNLISSGIRAAVGELGRLGRRP